MSGTALINGRADGGISPFDRGLAYGDGLFETILFVHGVAPRWERHMARLSDGCRRLAMPLPDASLLLTECRQMGALFDLAAVRITWTRGVGPRGYAVPSLAVANRIVSAAPAPEIRRDWVRDGIRLRCCALRLAVQPMLAGIKHCNRLEQVLARMEWDDPSIDEGLLFDTQDRLISATAANVFVRIDGRWCTPALDCCGVEGVTRAEILSSTMVDVCTISRKQVMQADEIFLCSALRGIVPVAAIDAQRFQVGAQARQLQAQWFDAHGLSGVGA